MTNNGLTYMGLLTSTVSITRYRVDGTIEDPVRETVEKGLKRYTIEDIDGEPEDRAVGWTPFGDPFHPDFSAGSFEVGAYFVFSLRIDKKSIPPKIVKKHLLDRIQQRLRETGRDYLSRSEKQELKDDVIGALSIRMPPVPNVYDLLWSYEEKWLWFFSNQKGANEELETLFSHAFDLTLIRLFPYTMAELTAGLDPAERDELSKLTHTRFVS